MASGKADPLAEALATVLRPLVFDAVREVIIELEQREPPPALLTRAQLARELGCCTKTVARLERENLPHLMLGDAPRYELHRVLEFLRSRNADQ